MRPRRTAILALGYLLAIIAPAASARDLSFDERVEAQAAIERFYWSRRAWPGDNPTPKPPLEAVLPVERIQARVTDHLRKTAALRDRWGATFTTADVQAEIDRMARETRRPGELRTLWAALGDDPFLVAECLVRPRLVEREIRARYTQDATVHAGVRQQAEAEGEQLLATSSTAGLEAQYSEVTWVRAGEVPPEELPEATVLLGPEEWDALWAMLASVEETSIPAGRTTPLQENDDAFFVVQALDQHDDTLRTATLTWPKIPFGVWWETESAAHVPELVADGGTYTLAASSPVACEDGWATTQDTGAPSRRFGHTAVWTGSEMIVWGGRPNAPTTDTNTGGRYDPVTDSWTPTSTGTGVPSARSFQTAVWTGTEMIVWGGQYSAAGSELNTGGRYAPTTDAWAPTSTGTGVLTPRTRHTAVWTGSEMIVWGGAAPGVPVGAAGARYVPSGDRWVSMPNPDPLGGRRSDHRAVWTGRYMIVWGGRGVFGPQRMGEAYDPSFQSWAPIAPPPPALASPIRFSAVWTGAEMIVWGGNVAGATGQVNTGGRYNPSFNAWSLTSTAAGVPARREDHTAVWTGTEMIVWGGNLPFGPVYGGGARYDPLSDTWTPTSVGTGVPTARYEHTAVWTGREMIVWGGHGSGGSFSDGGRYSAEFCDDGNPCTMNDRCDAGVCMGDPVVCEPLDACHVAGVCDPGTGVCSNPTAPDGTPCDDASACTTSDSCQTGVCTGGPLECNDGNNCTDDACDPAVGCTNESNDTCTGEPKGQGYWKRLCRGPHASGEFISTFDVDCVNDSCTFATVETVAELCDRMDPDPSHDKCEKGEAQLMALLLNTCRTRVSDSTAIESDCGDDDCGDGQGSDHTMRSTVGESMAEADALLCDPAHGHDDCARAQCLSEEINSGEALGINTLRLERVAGGVRLTWDPPYHDPVVAPSRYVISRSRLSDGVFVPIAETTALEHVDTAPDAESNGYDVRPVW